MASEFQTDSLAKPIIAHATNANEMLAAMGAYERWKYPGDLAKDQTLRDKNGKLVANLQGTSLNYERMYPVLLREAIAGVSADPERSFGDRIQYLKQVKKIYAEMSSNGEL